METVIILSEMGILLVGWWLVCNVSQRYWTQRELLAPVPLLVPVPQQGEADTAGTFNADTIADNTNADTINADTIIDIWSF